jgi:hypothetical protein
MAVFLIGVSVLIVSLFLLIWIFLEGEEDYGEESESQQKRYSNNKRDTINNKTTKDDKGGIGFQVVNGIIFFVVLVFSYSFLYFMFFLMYFKVTGTPPSSFNSVIAVLSLIPAILLIEKRRKRKVQDKN